MAKSMFVLMQKCGDFLWPRVTLEQGAVQLGIASLVVVLVSPETERPENEPVCHMFAVTEREQILRLGEERHLVQECCTLCVQAGVHLLNLCLPPK